MLFIIICLYYVLLYIIGFNPQSIIGGLMNAHLPQDLLSYIPSSLS